jgi:hypothetical protein
MNTQEWFDPADISPDPEEAAAELAFYQAKYRRRMRAYKRAEFRYQLRTFARRVIAFLF